jgi:hypothetical protein
MPDRPDLPQVIVARTEARVRDGHLPITRATTLITMPDGKQFELLGGFASPLGWIPMPVFGCALDSGAPRWVCSADFWRQGFTPIVSGDERVNRDIVVLARALGLRRVAVAERRGGDATRVLARAAAVEDAALARQLANIDAMAADPLPPVTDWEVDVVLGNKAALASRADTIMAGVERAAAAGREQESGGRARGQFLARLLAGLPHERFVSLGPRVLAVYAAAEGKHWLWDAEPLLRRLGDLGVGALPYLTDPRALSSRVNRAGVEGLCRVGAGARSAAYPILLMMWNDPRGYDNETAEMLYVAMRRIGATPPPLPNDSRIRFGKIQADWAAVTPQSPPQICTARADWDSRL